jgi:hypothetical protein
VSKTTCEACNKTIVDCRRYSLDALADFMKETVPAACRRVGISGSSENDARCHGITRRVAEKAAGLVKEHPATIWPEIVDHDIEDASRICAAEDCDQTFIGHPNKRYCSGSCKRRIQARRHRERHPEKYAARMREWKERNADEYRTYNRRYQRRYMRLRRARMKEEAA